MNTSPLKQTATVAALLLTLGAGSAQAQSAPSGTVLHTQRLASGTTVKVTLLRSVSSDNARPGDTVQARVAPDDKSGLPIGTVFTGRVTEAKPATAKLAGVLAMQLGVTGPGSDDTSLGSNTPQLAFSDQASARIYGQGARADKSQYTSIGAGAGALLGFVRKRKLGDAIGGAVLGGAGGYAANQAQKRAGGDVTLPKGSEMTLHLDTPLILRTEIVTPY